MRNIVIAAILLLAATTSFANDAQRMDFIINDTFRILKTDAQIDQFMHTAIGYAAKEMPVQLDELTVANSVIYNKVDNQIMYTMTILIDNLLESDIDYVRNKATAMSCSTPYTRAMLDNNISLRYTYYDINKKFIDDFVITQRFCDNQL